MPDITLPELKTRLARARGFCQRDRAWRFCRVTGSGAKNAAPPAGCRGTPAPSAQSQAMTRPLSSATIGLIWSPIASDPSPSRTRFNISDGGSGGDERGHAEPNQLSNLETSSERRSAKRRRGRKEPCEVGVRRARRWRPEMLGNRSPFTMSCEARFPADHLGPTGAGRPHSTPSGSRPCLHDPVRKPDEPAPTCGVRLRSKRPCRSSHTVGR